MSFNACLQTEAFRNGEFDRVMERAREFGACLIQLIKPKPAGAWLQSGTPASGADDLAVMTEAVKVFPLSKEATMDILGKVNRGPPTKVYSDIENLTCCSQ